MQRRSQAKYSLPAALPGLLAWGTFERRKRAQELSSAVPVLVQQDTHENESEHDHLTTQPLRWLADETPTRPAHRSAAFRSHIRSIRTVQAEGGPQLTAPIEPAMMRVLFVFFTSNVSDTSPVTAPSRVSDCRRSEYFSSTEDEVGSA